jgi:pimeloyl-ACP methyl ester carboxylesterase
VSAAARTQRFSSFDGTAIAWHEVGDGRPLVLLHGLFSNAKTNWLRWGTADAVAAAGVRVIMPDFRAHGASSAPQDAAAYPADVLSLDVEALVAHLGLTDFDLGGYSLGSRTAVRLVIRGMRPRRVVLGGMGIDGIVGTGRRTDFFLRVIETREHAAAGTPEWMAAQFMKSTGVDPEGAAHMLRSQVPTRREALSAIAMPALVVSGADDHENGSALALAQALPDARYVEIPGSHMSVVTQPELGLEIRDFVAGSPAR